jgi:hypothetical protein
MIREIIKPLRALMSIWLLLLFPTRSTAEGVADVRPIPLEKGTRWIYEGKVKWTPSEGGAAKSSRIRWVTEVLEAFTSSNIVSAVVRGFPDELTWYEPGQIPGFCVLLDVGDKLYRMSAPGRDQAKALALKLSRNHKELPANAEELLDLPLVVGHKWGQDKDDPPRSDTWYCWCVERVRARTLNVKGTPLKGPSKVYQLAYRTCPEHLIFEIAPGLGVVRYIYDHHGTVASVDLHLVEYCQP